MAQESLDLWKEFNRVRAEATEKLRSVLSSDLVYFSGSIGERIQRLQEIMPPVYKGVLPYPPNYSKLVRIEKSKITVDDRELKADEYIFECLEKCQEIVKGKGDEDRSIEDQYDFLEAVQKSLLMLENDILTKKK